MSQSNDYIQELLETEEFEEFEDMEFLSDQMQVNIYEYGFKVPSFVQMKIIHRIYAGQDLIVESDSGTGKTGAFVIGALSRIDPKKVHPQVIIIANTKQLSKQIKAVVDTLNTNMGIYSCLCIGNNKGEQSKNNSARQNAKKARKSHILIGTPGRLMNMASMKVYNSSDIRTVIMDEADHLLKTDGDDDRGFINQIKVIVRSCSGKTQFCLFSATYTREAFGHAEKITHNPQKIVINQEKSTDRIYQYCIDVSIPTEDKYNRSGKMLNERRINGMILDDKISVVIDLFGKLNIEQAIIFTNNRRDADALYQDLLNSGFTSTEIISGKTDASRRDMILKDFRLAKIKFLISTDFISRGFDVDDLRCIINFDFPEDPQTYIHRIGRSGRFGGEGIAINLITNEDRILINNIREEYPDVYINNELPVLDEINGILTGMSKPIDKASAKQLVL